MSVPPHLPHPDLVGDHLGLVDATVRRLGHRLPGHVDRDDLVGAGRVALVEAARQFDPARETAFAAFAAPRVRGAMLDELRRSDWTSRTVRREDRRHGTGLEALAARLGRTPTPAELAESLGITEGQLRDHQRDAHRGRVASLELLLGGDGGAEAPATAEATSPSPVEAVIEGEQRAHLHAALAALPPRLRRVVVGRHLQELSVHELAVELGVTASRVSQLCAEGLVALRRALGAHVDDVTARRASPAGTGRRAQRAATATCRATRACPGRPDRIDLVDQLAAAG